MIIRWQSRQLLVLLESLGHSFQIGGEMKTELFNSDHCMHLLQNKFILAMHWCSDNIANIYFQQDGATLHMSGQVFTWLEKLFRFILISIKMDCSNHIHPIEVHWTFLRWGFLNNKVYISDTKAKHPKESQICNHYTP